MVVPSAMKRPWWVGQGLVPKAQVPNTWCLLQAEGGGVQGLARKVMITLKPGLGTVFKEDNPSIQWPRRK